MPFENYDDFASEEEFYKIKNQKTKKQLIEELYLSYKRLKDVENKSSVVVACDSIAQNDLNNLSNSNHLDLIDLTHSASTNSDSLSNDLQPPSLLENNDKGSTNTEAFDVVSQVLECTENICKPNKTSIEERFDALESLVRSLANEVNCLRSSKLASSTASEVLQSSVPLVPPTKDIISAPCECDKVCKCKPSSNDNTSNTQKKVIILSDSQGHAMAGKMASQLNGKAEVFSFIRPGCNLGMVLHGVDDILKKEKMGDEDHIVIMGGSNDVESGTATKELKATLKKITAATKKTNVIVVSIPPRYDLPVKYLDTVNTYNSVIRSFVKNSSAQFCELDKLNSKCFTNHGLHYSNYGKNFVAKQLAEMIMSKPFFVDNPASGNEQDSNHFLV